MPTKNLPERVRQAWGTDVAQDFLNWLEEQLSQAGVMPGVQISAFVARQKVNVLILERVSNLLLAGEPALIQASDQNWLWRVPVDLTYSSRGRVGQVGEIDVDARYGEVRYTDDLLTNIAHRSQQLSHQILHPVV